MEPRIHGRVAKRLQRHAAAGFLLAAFLTAALGALSLSHARKAAKEDERVVHTRKVIAVTAATLRHLDGVEANGRGFLLTGEQSFLDPYQEARRSVAEDLAELRGLARDNLSRQRRLDLLENEVNAQTALVTQRQGRNTPPAQQLEQSTQTMGAARNTISEIDRQERKLLEECMRRSDAATRISQWTLALTVLLDVIFLTAASLTIHKLVATNALHAQQIRERSAQLTAIHQELSSFTYSVSHDLRAPLRQIAGFAQILLEDFQLDLAPEALRHVSQISQGAQTMTHLINEMLNLSRLERQSLQPRRTSLNDLVTEAIAMLRPEIQNRHVEWRIASLPEWECDPFLTRQIFYHLISNALKFSRSREQAVIEIDSCEHDGHTAVFVRDNGIGFDMKYADKLFGAFQRLHSSSGFEGIGVGLATVARIVRKHGGKAWAEGEPNRGAAFYFTLGTAAAALPRLTKAAAAGRTSRN